METYVLLVDDEPNVLHALTRTLRQQPYKLLTARSAEEARHVLQSHPVAVVVTDENMPGISGTEMLGWVAEQCPEVVRIVLTGANCPETTMRAVNQGKVFRFFSKPFSAVEMAVSIGEAIDLHHSIKARMAASQA